MGAIFCEELQPGSGSFTQVTTLSLGNFGLWGFSFSPGYLWKIVVYVQGNYYWNYIHFSLNHDSCEDFFVYFTKNDLIQTKKPIESYLKPCQQILPRAGGACSSPWVGMAALATAVGFTPTCCAKLSWHWATGRIVGWRCKKTSLGRFLQLEPLVSFGWMLFCRFGKFIFNSCRCVTMWHLFLLKDIYKMSMTWKCRKMSLWVWFYKYCQATFPRIFGVVSWLPQAFRRTYPAKAIWMIQKKH